MNIDNRASGNTNTIYNPANSLVGTDVNYNRSVPATPPPSPIPNSDSSFNASHNGGSFFGSLWDGISSMGSHIGSSVGQLFGGLANGVGNLVYGVGNALGGVATGIGSIFTGEFSKGFSQIGGGLYDAVISAPVSALISGVGESFYGLTTLLGISSPPQALDEHQRKLLSSVFGDSIDLDNVRVQESPSWMFNEGRQFVLGNTIHVPSGTVTPDRTLVHEAAHVWQYQNNGAGYIADSILQQLMHGSGAYELQDVLKAGLSFHDMNVEQQGELLRMAYHAGAHMNPGMRIIIDLYAADQPASAVGVTAETAKSKLDYGNGRYLDISRAVYESLDATRNQPKSQQKTIN